jgi:tetratricopeptide (TPR) repeat protein
VQGAWRAKQARKEKRKKVAALRLNEAVNGWVVVEFKWVDRRKRTKKSPYWWSTTTGHITWDKPQELGGGINANLIQEWTKVYSPPDNRFYYYSNWTQDITWLIPTEYKDPPTGLLAEMFMNPELRAALTIQGLWRQKQARRVTRAVKARYASAMDNGRVFRGWVTEWDATAKADFYYNIETGEISWKLPTVLMVPKWIKVHNPITKYYYYVNNDTGEQTTEKPDDYHSPRGPHAKLLAKMITNPELRSAMAIQRAFRSRQRRRLAMASVRFKHLIEIAETYDTVIPKDGALGFHLAEPDGDIGGNGVGEGASVPGTMFQQYPAIVKNIVAHGQAEQAGINTGDLLSGINKVCLVGKTMKDAIHALRKQPRPVTVSFRRRFVPDPEYPRIKYPRIPQAHMGWLECEFDDVHYGHVRYWWKIDTHHLTIIPPPPFAALEQARKEALLYQPRSLEMKQRFRTARALIDDAPRNPKHRMALARLHLEDDNPKGAMKQMERVVKTPKLCDDHGDGYDVWELVGDAYFAYYHKEWKRKDLDVAWRAYQKMAQRMHVPKPQALMNLAKCYEAYGAYEGAALVLGDLISLHKDWKGFDEAVFHAGVLLKHLKQYKDSALYLAYLAAHDVGTIDKNTIWFQVAHCYHLAGDDASAMEGIGQIFHNHRRELLNRNPPITSADEYVQSSQIWDEQGHELFGHGMYTMAADAFRHALLRAPSPWDTWPETWANLALSLHRTCEREQAETILLKGIEIHKGNKMLEALHLKISEEYAAAAMAEQRAALMVQHRFRQRLRKKREAKVQAALDDATFQKAADMLRHILQAHAITFLRTWRDYTKYTVGIRKFSQHIMSNATRICMEGWKKYFMMAMKEKSIRTGFTIQIQRCVRAYNVRTIPMRAQRIRNHQDRVVKRFVRRMQMQGCVKCLVTWRAHVDKMQRVRAVYAKIVKRYMKFCFYAWVKWLRSLPSQKFYGATQLQTTWRSMVARVEYKRLRGLQQKAAELIQARIRARVARVKARYKRWKQGIVHKKAAVQFQKVRRGYLARRFVWRDMVHGAVLFQAAWRSKRCRLRRGFASRKIQVAWAVSYVKQLPVRDEAAARIQCIFRGHVCRLWVRLNQATTKITAVYRGHAARLKVDHLKGRLRKFWAHLLFSNESNGVPGNMTARMIEHEDKDAATNAEKHKYGVSLSGFLASPDRHQRLVPAVWSQFPVKKEQIRTLAGGNNRGSNNSRHIPVPIFNSPGRKTMSWVRSEAHLPKQRVPKAKLPAFAIQKTSGKRPVMRDVINPTAPRLFADTTMSSGWSSLHAIYLMPPAEERPTRPPSAAVERLSYLARELPDDESMDMVDNGSGENDGYGGYGGYAGVYAAGGSGGSSSYDSGGFREWGESRETSETLLTSDREHKEVGEVSKRPKHLAVQGKVQFPTPNVGLRQRKRLLGRALGSNTAKEGSAAHVLVGSGDVGLLQSFMKLRAGGKMARSMISGSVGNGASSPKRRGNKKRTKKKKGKNTQRRGGNNQNSFLM